MSKSVTTPHVSNVYIFKGNAYANIPQGQTPQAYRLEVGGAKAPFEKASIKELLHNLPKIELHIDAQAAAKNLSFTPSPTQEGSDAIACWVNELADWTLTGAQTIQLMVADYKNPYEIAFNTPLIVDSPEANYEFRTSLGAHRAQADFIVTFTDCVTGETLTERVPFDPAYVGGQLPSGYLKYSKKLPFTGHQTEISIQVDYQAYHEDDTGIEPFIFIANTRVTVPGRDKALLTPHLALGDGFTQSGQWISAPLPHIVSPNDTVILHHKSKQMPLFTAQEPTVKIAENYGHTLSLKAQEAQNVVLHVDGEAAARLNLMAGDNIVRIPARYLNGVQRHVSLKDPSGTQTLDQTICVLPNVITPADVLQRETAAPFPNTVFPQTARRYESLKAQMAHSGAETDHAQLAWALSVLEGGYDNVKLKPLVFPKVKKPDVSIIIPAHNKVEVTYLALCSLLLAHNTASFEVIVVDDASTDETAELESFVSGITVLHNETAQRFIRACNAGAQKAKGDYIVLLNNDVEVTTGWLDELMAAFTRFENVGLAGSKLLYPNGELQDAGGIIWGTGNPWNYGNRQNADDPRFCYARQADYLSGAAMMVPHKLWKAVGGLSHDLEPMYFEDTDFAFKVRDAGYSTWFVPSSVVYHYEGMTSGTDTSTGFKKFQEVNRPKFKRKWAKAYANFGKEGHQPDLEKDRGIVGRVLFTDYATPRGDQDAGSYAALQEMRLVQSLGYKVSFLPMNMAHFGSYTDELQKMGIEVIYAPFFLSPREYLERHATDFDAFYITRFYVGQQVLDMMRQFNPQARVLFNNADLHFLREIRTAKAHNDTHLMEVARETRTQELRIINQADVILSYNDVEHSVIEAYTDGAAKITTCPWVVDIPAKTPSLKTRSGMSFLGSYRHHPNAEGITWFVKDVMNLVQAKAKGIDLTIYGAGMTEDIKALKSDVVNPQGFVANIADAYDDHRIFIAPLLSGAGIKGKVLSALAHGIPCVLSPVAAEGVGLRHKHDCFIAQTPDEWATAIGLLNSDDDLWQQISTNAQTYMKNSFSFEEGRIKMRTAFEMADLFGFVE